MNPYERGKIYTIRCRNDDNLIYVGSTIEKLCKRMCKHRYDSKIHPEILVYKEVLKSSWNDWYIELFENHPCNSKEELLRKEGEVIRKIGSLNEKIAGRSAKEWRQDNSEFCNQYNKEYRKTNKEKIAETKKTYEKKIKKK